MNSPPEWLARELSLRVYYEDTDAAGVVYYANYLKFFERGRTEWLRSFGVDQMGLASRDQTRFVVRRADIVYHHPARLDDCITIRTAIREAGASFVVFHQQALRAERPLATANVQICAVRSANLKPTRLPPILRTLLQKALN